MKLLRAFLALTLWTVSASAQQLSVSPSGGGVWVPFPQQTVSAGATMQWTGLGTAYNNYYLLCYGVFPATDNTKIYLQFGEGGTPTWEVTGYRYAGAFGNSANTTGGFLSSAGTDSGLDLSAGGAHNNAAQSVSAAVMIYNFPSTTLNTTAQSAITFYSTGSTTQYAVYLHSMYTADTGAKTALRVIAATGNETGTCDLWGLAGS